MDFENQNPQQPEIQPSETIQPTTLLEHTIDQPSDLTQTLAEFQNEIRQEKADNRGPTPETSDDEFQVELEAGNGSDEEFEGNPETKFKTKNEVKPVIANTQTETFEERYKRYKIEPERVSELIPVGTIVTLMSENIIIQSNSNEVLDLDNLLFTKDKILLGNIDDVFGKVEDPRYTLFRDGYLSSRITEGMIKVGDTIYYERSLTKIIPQSYINHLKMMRGSDASNKFDEEVLNNEDIEFSDDEKEEAFKSEHNHKKQKKSNKPEVKPKEKIEFKQNKRMNQFNANVGMTQSGMQFINFSQPQQFMMNPQPMAMPLFGMNPGMMMQQQPFIYNMPMQNAPLNINPMFGQNMMMQQMNYQPQPLLNNNQQQQQQQQQQFQQIKSGNNNFQVQNGLNKNFFG